MKMSKRVRAGLGMVLMAGIGLAPLTVSAQQMQGTLPPSLTTGPYHPTQGDRVGAGFLNVVYVPGKAILCGTGTLASAGLMLLTFGSAYHEAVGLFTEGCGGKWVLTPYDVAEKRAPEDSY
jgi:hypothetical protein